MNDNKKYNTLINDKFREFSFQDMDSTWPEMKAILDREMPEKRRRGFLFWFNSQTIIALSLFSVSIVCLVYFKHSNQIADSQQVTITKATNKIIKQPASKKTLPSYTDRTPVSSTKETQVNYSQEHKATNPEQTTTRSKNSDLTTTTQSTVLSTQGRESKHNKSNNKQQLQSNPVVLTDANRNDNNADRKNDRPNQFTKEKQNVIINEPGMIVHSIASATTKDSISKALAALAEKKGLAAEIANTLNKQTADSNTIAIKKPKTGKVKGWVAGASINYNLPVSGQEMSTVNINGKKNTLIDFLPSLYVQYHFNKQWFVESGFQFSSPQYISNHKLSSQKNYPDPNKCEESAIWLNKLYYLNVPASIHFQPLPNLTIGTGIQYSYLRRSIFEDEQATWEKQAGGKWTKTASSKTVKVKSNTAVKSNNSNGNNNGSNGNGNGNGNGSNGNGNNPATAVLPTRLDTVARTLRSSDWRLLFDVNYSWRRINLGCSFNYGLDNYINTKSGNTILPVKDRNEALQFYLRYAIFDRRKKSTPAP